MSNETSDLWKALSSSHFSEVDDAFLQSFRRPGGPNSRLAAWDPFDPTMRYFKFMLFKAAERQPNRFFECWPKLGDTGIGSPVTVRARGFNIDIDYLLSVDEFLFLEKAIDLSTVRRVVEIGAGFGRTCHALLALLPSIEEYVIVDLEGMLELSRRALTKVIPQYAAKIKFVRAEDTAAWTGLKSDLAINIDSFQEMLPQTIIAYRNEILHHSRNVYIKNPIAKYTPQMIGIVVEDQNKFHDVFSLGLCRDIIDIFDDSELEVSRRRYVEAYRPGPSWKCLREEPLDMFPYLHHAVYSAE